MRQVVLDTETTGLEVEEGHRILEIGCVEIVGRKLTRRHYHQYINPERESDDGALEVHGITSQFLADKPVFSDVWENFFQFVNGSELIIHNSAFDVGFLNREMRLHDRSLGKLTDYCSVIDSLALARTKHPGQKNNLDALCKRYSVDNSQRQLHGALLDAEILADVYLLLTGGQVTLGLEENVNNQKGRNTQVELDPNRTLLKVIKANEQELIAHENKLEHLDEKSEVGAVWRGSSKGKTG
jgi:DNA polymerase-3 subunit epsilon